jgi:hypothetical protein
MLTQNKPSPLLLLLLLGSYLHGEVGALWLMVLSFCKSVEK